MNRFMLPPAGVEKGRIVVAAQFNELAIHPNQVTYDRGLQNGDRLRCICEVGCLSLLLRVLGHRGICSTQPQLDLGQARFLAASIRG